MVKSALSPARPKNTGMNSATISPRNCSSMWRVRIGDSPTRMPATNAPSTSVTPITLRDQRHRDHDDQNGRDDGQIADESFVGKRIRREHQRDGRSSGLRPETAPFPARSSPADQTSMRPAAGQAECDGDDDPTDRVVDDGRGDDDLTDVAAHEIHLADHHRHDLHRRDRQRVPRNNAVIEPRIRVAAAASRASIAPSANPQANGMATPATATAAARRPTRLHQLQVGFHAGQQQQHQNAELRTRLRSCFSAQRPVGNRTCCACGHNRPSTDGPSKIAADQLPHHCRLTDPLHHLAHNSADQQQYSKLGDKRGYRAFRRRLLSGQRSSGNQNQNDGNRDEFHAAVRQDRRAVPCVQKRPLPDVIMQLQSILHEERRVCGSARGPVRPPASIG